MSTLREVHGTRAKPFCWSLAHWPGSLEKRLRCPPSGTRIRAACGSARNRGRRDTGVNFLAAPCARGGGFMVGPVAWVMPRHLAIVRGAIVVRGHCAPSCCWRTASMRRPRNRSSAARPTSWSPRPCISRSTVNRKMPINFSPRRCGRPRIAGRPLAQRPGLCLSQVADVDAAVQLAADDNRLPRYIAHRAEAADTVEAQLKLAAWCRREGLLDQQRAASDPGAANSIPIRQRPLAAGLCAAGQRLGLDRRGKGRRRTR